MIGDFCSGEINYCFGLGNPELCCGSALYEWLGKLFDFWEGFSGNWKDLMQGCHFCPKNNNILEKFDTALFEIWSCFIRRMRIECCQVCSQLSRIRLDCFFVDLALVAPFTIVVSSWFKLIKTLKSLLFCLTMYVFVSFWFLKDQPYSSYQMRASTSFFVVSLFVRYSLQFYTVTKVCFGIFGCFISLIFVFGCNTFFPFYGYLDGGINKITLTQIYPITTIHRSRGKLPLIE